MTPDELREAERKALTIINNNQGRIKQQYLAFRQNADAGIALFNTKTFNIADGVVGRIAQNGPQETMNIVVRASVVIAIEPEVPVVPEELGRGDYIVIYPTPPGSYGGPGTDLFVRVSKPVVSDWAGYGALPDATSRDGDGNYNYWGFARAYSWDYQGDELLWMEGDYSQINIDIRRFTRAGLRFIELEIYASAGNNNTYADAYTFPARADLVIGERPTRESTGNTDVVISNIEFNGYIQNNVGNIGGGNGDTNSENMERQGTLLIDLFTGAMTFTPDWKPGIVPMDEPLFLLPYHGRD